MLEKNLNDSRKQTAAKLPKFPGLKKLALKDIELRDFLIMCKDEEVRKKAISLIEARIHSVH